MSKPYTDQRLYNLYEEELKDLTYTPTGLFDKLLHKASRKFAPKIDLTYSFTVPVSEYLRGEIFCDDVSEIIERQFTQSDLISILLVDFLYQAKRRNNPYDLYRELSSRVQQQSIEVFNYNGENETLHINKETQRKKELDCIIKRKEALRIEVMLSDITDLEPEITFTVNDVLQILYSDFIQKYKTGELTNVLENITKRLSQ
ncbi:MAG: hypothetical protein ACQEWV_24375 [Bacillota bacterium]